MGQYGYDKYSDSQYGNGSENLNADVIGPLVTPVFPANSLVNIPVNTPIQLVITDEVAIDLSSVCIEINRGNGFEEAYAYGQTPDFKSGWKGPQSKAWGTPQEFNIIVDPELNFPASTVIIVRVNGVDVNNNGVRL